MSRNLEIVINLDGDAFSGNLCQEVNRILDRFGNDLYSIGVNHLLHGVVLMDVYGNACGTAQMVIEP